MSLWNSWLTTVQLLDPFGETAWIRHAAGAARLIQLRGTKSYNSEFEKALFMAHTGPIVRPHLAARLRVTS
jgi:hypothetical protein